MTIFMHCWSTTMCSGSSPGKKETAKRNRGGFVLARLVLDEAEILTIAVAPQAQRKGLGHALMDATLRHLAQCARKHALSGGR